MIALTFSCRLHDQSAIAEAKGETLTAEEARVALKDLIPNVKVLSVGQAPIAGLWEVAIDSGGRKGSFTSIMQKNTLSPEISTT